MKPASFATLRAGRLGAGRLRPRSLEASRSSHQYRRAVCLQAFLAIYRPGRGHDHHVGRDRGSRGLDCDPSGDRVRLGPGFPPSNPRNIGRRRGVA